MAATAVGLVGRVRAIAVGAAFGLVALAPLTADGSTARYGVDAAVTAEQRDRAAMLMAAAQLAPPDATGYVHIEDAWDIFERVRDRPVAQAMAEMLGHASVRDAWDELARRAGESPETLFRDLLGDRVTIITRDVGVRTEWVAVLHGAGDEVLRRGASLGLAWDPALGFADDQNARYSSKPLQLRFAFVQGSVVVSPLRPVGDRSDLPRDVIARIRTSGGAMPAPPTDAVARAAANDSLWTADGIDAAAELGTGSVAAWFNRSDADGGGWTAMLLDVPPDENGRVRASVASASDRLPFARPRTEVRWIPDLLPALEQRFILAMAEPADIGFGTAGLRLERALGHPLIPAAAADSDRRLYVLGEVDGRPLAPSVKRPVPALAVVIPTSSPQAVYRDLDGHFVGLLDGMAAMIEDPEAEGPPPVLALDAALNLNRTHGHADLAPFWREALAFEGAEAEAAADGELPLPWRAIDLVWGLATARPADRSPQSFIVVATHPSHLRAVTQTIERAQLFGFGDANAAGVLEDQWASRGCMDGIRAALHLDGLVDLAPQLTDPGRGDLAFTLRGSLDRLGRLLGSTESVRWQLRRPSADRMRLDLDVRLSGPPTQTVSSRGG